MINTNLKLDLHQLSWWFSAIRNLPDEERFRALEAVWDTQLQGKAWLVNELNKIIVQQSNVYVFGGWVGILPSMILQACKWVNKVRSIDIDPWCESIADTVCKPHEMNQWRFKAVTSDMAAYSYDFEPHIVINTSSEHVDQSTYDQWYNNIPSGSIVVVQGNNFKECDEHVRCSESLEEFCEMSNATNVLYSGELPNPKYTRYMCIWRKP